LERTKNHEHGVGELLPANPNYVETALDECAIFGLRVILGAWRKIGNDLNHLLSHLNYRCYDSLVYGRYPLARALAHTQTEYSPPGSDYSNFARVNGWIARSRLGEDVADEVEGWDVGPLALRYRIAKASLLDDFDGLSEMLPTALDTGEIHRDSLLNWPLFRSLREQPLFTTLLEHADAAE
jgi:hypothetical protein